MNQDSRTLLSLVAAGRMTSAEAERWLAASRQERLDRSEQRWVLVALALAAVTQLAPALTESLHWVGAQLPQALTGLHHLAMMITSQF
jgi:hypothetical protein